MRAFTFTTQGAGGPGEMGRSTVNPPSPTAPLESAALTGGVVFGCINDARVNCFTDCGLSCLEESPSQIVHTSGNIGPAETKRRASHNG